MSSVQAGPLRICASLAVHAYACQSWGLLLLLAWFANHAANSHRQACKYLPNTRRLNPCKLPASKVSTQQQQEKEQ